MMSDVLIIGPLPSSSPRSIGGATLLMKSLLDFIEKEGSTRFDFLELRKCWFKYGQFIDFPRVFFEVLIRAKKCKLISFHTSWDFALTFGPFLVFLLLILKKRVTFHFFGGDMHLRISRLPRFYQKFVFRTVFSVSVIHVETKEMMSFFTDKVEAKVCWFPNCRVGVFDSLQMKVYRRKFVFLSRICENKGVNELLEAFKVLGSSYTLDFYGPIDIPDFLDKILPLSNISYRGIASSGEVRNVLDLYDMLLLPSYYSGEGYPGVVIEGFSIGVPVLTTRWRSIPEIVLDNQNGLLVDVKCSKQIVEVIKGIDDHVFQRLRNDSFRSFRNFDIEIVGGRWMKEVLINSKQHD